MGAASNLSSSPPKSTNSWDNPYDVIVIGAGVGGLTAAALLARWGFKVAVFEQHYLAGGCCTSWERKTTHNGERLRFVFDAGVHAISGAGPGGTIARRLQELAVADQVTWLPVEQAYHIGDHYVRLPCGDQALCRALGELFPHERAALRRYISQMRALHDSVHRLYRGAAAHSRSVAPDPLWLQDYTAYLRSCFSDPRLVALLTVATSHLTDDPGQLNLMHMAPILGFLLEGGHYPRGGAQRLPEALVSAFERDGGTLRLRMPVTSIILEDERAVGVTVSSRSGQPGRGASRDGNNASGSGSGSGNHYIRSRAVISNADAKATGARLLAPATPEAAVPSPVTAFRDQLCNLKPSPSAHMVFLGLACIPDIPAAILGEMTILTPSVVDPTLASPGHATMALIRTVPAAEAATWQDTAPTNSAYAQRKEVAAQAMLARAEALLPGLSQHIVYAEAATPRTQRHYTWADQGAIYGPSWEQPRLPVQSPISGLFMVGSAVHPGPGVEGVVTSGRWAAQAVAEFLS